MTCWDSHPPVVIGEAAQAWADDSSEAICHHPEACHHSLHLAVCANNILTNWQRGECLPAHYPEVLHEMLTWGMKVDFDSIWIMTSWSSHLSMQMREPMYVAEVAAPCSAMQSPGSQGRRASTRSRGGAGARQASAKPMPRLPRSKAVNPSSTPRSSSQPKTGVKAV